MGIDDKKIKVYESIYRMLMQFILTVVAIIVFFIVLKHFLKTDDLHSKVAYGIFDAVLGPTMYTVFKYFFPIKGKK
jgi:multidrug transporter EmrE-like cation transporter